MADKKVRNVLKLIKKFIYQKEISSYDEAILDEFDCSQKTLERYLKDIEENFDHIIRVKKSKQHTWKLIKISDIFEEFIKNSYDISQLFLMAREFDPDILKELESSTFKKLVKAEDDIFVFKNYIFEELQNPQAKGHFNILKEAIRNKNYVDISFNVDFVEDIERVIPFRLLFIANNWYITVILDDGNLELKRIAFIKELKVYSSKYSLQNPKPYIDFLANIQNSLTLFNKPKKIAKIKATKNIAHYFEKDMKKHLISQKYLKTLEDGSVIFSLEYTQPFEIIILIQRFLPDLIVLEPQELRDEFLQKLQIAIKNHQELNI